jgi:uncharacterized BrkB/YihY/UPF0761 family membrane protein
VAIAVLVLFPERMGLSEIEYPMGIMSAVAFSWGILLLMADRKPLKRKWILIPTIVVVALLTLVRILFELNDIIQFNLTYSLFGILLIILMVYSYYSASKFDRNGKYLLKPEKPSFYC